MKLMIVLSVMMALAVALPSKDTEALKSVDLDAIFTNDKQRQMIFDCLLEKAPCTDGAQVVKESVGHIIKNKCADCNEAQKQKYERIMKTFHDKYEDVYTEFVKKVQTQ